MKRQTVFSFAILGILMFILSSCGGGGAGAPGTGGIDDIGVILEAYTQPYYLSASWQISDSTSAAGTTSTINILGNLTNAVDVTQVDCSTDPLIPNIEPMAEHSAVLVINARLMNPNSPFKPGNLFITEYKVDYFRSTDSLTAPPIESDKRFTTIMIGTTSPDIGSGNRYSAARVVLVDLIRKMKYVQDLNSGMYTSRPGLLNNYTAEYTFYGLDSHGKSFSFKVRQDFTIGSYNNCGLLL